MVGTLQRLQRLNRLQVNGLQVNAAAQHQHNMMCWKLQQILADNLAETETRFKIANIEGAIVSYMSVGISTWLCNGLWERSYSKFEVKGLTLLRVFVNASYISVFIAGMNLHPVQFLWEYYR